MNGFGESSKPWGGDSSAPSEPAYSKDGSWKDLGTSMSAISFGLAATAILIAMFLVMAIFEHVIKPRASFLRPRSSAEASREAGQPHGHTIAIAIEKLQNSQTVSSPLAQFGIFNSRRRLTNQRWQVLAVDFPVLMPGQAFPTFIAQPSPLPWPREGMQWPPHDAGGHRSTFM